MEATQAAVAIFGMLAGVLVTWGIAWGVIQHARIQSQGWSLDVAQQGELAAMRDQAGVLPQQLADIHDRLDFTERIVARGGAPDQLQGGAG